MFKRPTKIVTRGLLTYTIVACVSSAARQVKGKEVTYIRLNRVAAMDGTSRACRQWGWGWGWGCGGGGGTSNHVNGTRRPEDGHEQDGEDSGNAVDHHLGEKTVVGEEEVASSSRLWEATAEDCWPFTPAFYPFPGVPIGCEAVWRFLIFSIHNLRDTPFILLPCSHWSSVIG
jgi:hypothetical protein